MAATIDEGNTYDTFTSRNDAAKTCVYGLHCRYYGNTDLDSFECGFTSSPGGIGVSGFNYTAQQSGFGYSFTYNMDVVVTWQGYIHSNPFTWTNYSAARQIKTVALAASAAAPVASAVTSNSCTVSGTFYPNTNQSTATVYLEYKKASDSTWTTLKTWTLQSGYSGIAYSESLTGLDGSTAYHLQIRMVRTTSSDVSFTSSSGSFTTDAAAPSITTVAASSVTHNSATLNASGNTNGFSSDVTYQWGTSPGSYPNETSPATNYPSGTITDAKTITGLTPSTTYYFRAKVVGNSITNYGSELSFTTQAATAPDIATDAATGVAYTTANLNGTVIPYGFSTTYYFEYGLTTGYGNTTATQGPSTSSTPVTFGQAISGLTPNTTYHYRAVAVYNSVEYYGSDQTFMTPTTPALTAALEDHLQIFEFNERKYGVQSTINFAVASPADTSSDRFFNAASPFVAGDVQISKDGGAFANVTNLPTRIGSTPNFSIVLTATEMQATTIVVMIVDQNGPAFRDAMLVIRTKQEIGQIVADATQFGGNTDAVLLTGVGTGKSINAASDIYTAGKIQTVGNVAVGGHLAIAGDLTVAGAMTVTGILSAASISGVLSSMSIRANTLQGGGAGYADLDTGASATNDYYKGSILLITSGTGAGQSRVIQAYNGTTKRCTVASWSTNPGVSGFVILPGPEIWTLSPGAELSAMPTFASTYGQLLQFIFQRFAYKREQDATSQKLYKADSSTVFAQGAFTDATTKQTIDKLV